MAINQIRVHGRWMWQARVAIRGFRRSAVRPTKGEAKQVEAELRLGLEAHVRQAETDASRPATLRQLFELYAAHLEARGKSDETLGRVHVTRAAVERLLPALLERPVTEIGDTEIFAFRQARDQAGAKPTTINRDLRTLRAMLRRVRPDLRFPARVFFPEDETRVRWLRPEEELTILEPLRAPIRQVAQLAALTLMRLGEIRLLRREHVHLTQGVVMLPRAKGGPRVVMLSREAQQILREQLARHRSEWVFPNPDGVPYDRSYIGRVFRAAARAGGRPDFTFHDLRHHGATMALNRGFSPPIVMALGGWKSERMMRRYAAVTDVTLRAAAEAVSGAADWRELGASKAEARAVGPQNHRRNGNGRWQRVRKPAKLRRAP